MIKLFTSTPTGTELAAIKKVLDSGWWDTGKYVEEFEKQWAEFVGAKYAVATNSCTSALDIAVRVVDLPKTVTVSPLTFVASALAPLNAGYKIRFVDIDPKTLCTPEADIQVLYAGNDYGKGKIYDMAHFGGGKHKGIVSCWSFQARKNLPTATGGMLTTNNKEIYQRAKAISDAGIQKNTYERSKGKYSWDYDIKEPGLNAYMNDITAAIGLEQLKMLPKRNIIRKQIAEWYDQYLSPEIVRPYPSTTWHMYVIRVPNRDMIYDKLRDKGIQAGLHYKPLYYYLIFPQKKLPNTEQAFKEIITLPMHVELTEQDVKKVCQTINALR